MSELIHSFTQFPAFGFESAKYNANTSRKENAVKDKDLQVRLVASNIFKVVGYFPALGSIVGICRLIDTLTDKTIKNKTPHIIRALFEIAHLGPLLLLIDSVVSLSRVIEYKPSKTIPVTSI